MKIIPESANICRLEIEGGQTFFLYDSTDGELQISEINRVPMTVSITYSKTEGDVGEGIQIRIKPAHKGEYYG